MDTPYFSNGNYLLLTDNVSPIIIGAINAVIVSGGNVIVITSDIGVKNKLQSETGVYCYVVNISGGNDIDFYDHHMPGSMEDVYLDGFPVWKALGIDRFRFWHLDKSEAMKFIDGINYDYVIVDLNLKTRISVLYEEFDNLIGLKSSTLRTREIFDFITTNNFNLIITDKEKDIPFINLIDDIKVKVWRNEDRVILPTERDRKKQGLILYYDKANLWQMNDAWGKYEFPAIVSFDERSIEIFPRCHPHIPLEVVSPNLLPEPDTLVMFSYDEEVVDKINPNNVILIDRLDINSCSIMSVGDRRVTEIINE